MDMRSASERGVRVSACSVEWIGGRSCKLGGRRVGMWASSTYAGLAIMCLGSARHGLSVRGRGGQPCLLLPGGQTGGHEETRVPVHSRGRRTRVPVHSRGRRTRRRTRVPVHSRGRPPERAEQESAGALSDGTREGHLTPLGVYEPASVYMASHGN